MDSLDWGGDFSAVPATIPEPATLGLAGLGATTLLAFRRKSNNN